MSKTSNILALDRGGTKCECLYVDGETGAVLKRLLMTAGDLPESVRTALPQNFHGGVGRSPAMLAFCLDKLFCGNYPQSLHTVTNCGLTIDEYLKQHNIRQASSTSLGEANSALLAENLIWGICLVAGTGTCGIVINKAGASHGLDAMGPDGGDWGGSTSIGRAFFRLTNREQSFCREILPDFRAIHEHFRTFPEYHTHSGEITPEQRWAPIGFLMQHQDRSYLASMAKVCDACARRGSTIARNVLEEAGRDLTETARRAAVFLQLAQEPDLHVVATGSVLLHSDFVFNSMKTSLQEVLPQATLLRGRHPQVRGLVIHTFNSLPECQKQLEYFLTQDVSD